MATGRSVERSAGVRVDGMTGGRQLVGEKGKLHAGESRLELRNGNQSGGHTVTLLVLPLNGFWLGFERQRLEASPVEELEQVLSMEKRKSCCPQAHKDAPEEIHQGHNPGYVHSAGQLRA